MKKRSKVFLIALIVIVIAAAGIALKVRSPDAVPVTTEKASYSPLRSIVTASGNIVPHKGVDISANIMGEIQKIAIREGDHVEKGDLLIVIDPEFYRSELRREEANLASAEAELALSRSKYQRAEEIYSKKPAGPDESLISKEEYEGLLAEYRVAQSNFNRVTAQVESARTNLGKTSIYSPIAGVVTSLNVEEGEVAVTGTMNNPGTVLLTVSDLSKMQAEVEVDETDIVNVELGQQAEVTIDAYPDTIFQGFASEIGNSPIISSLGSAGEEAVDFKVVIDLNDLPPGLKPGLSTTADIVTKSLERALSIPIQALTMRSAGKSKDGEEPKKENEKEDEAEGVFVVKGKKAIFTPVTTGISDGMNIEIISGLVEGDEVVTGSFQTIRTIQDSTQVKPTDILPAEETAATDRE